MDVTAAARLIANLTYKPGWAFRIGGPRGRYLCVFARTVDSSNHARGRTTQHMFEIPALAGRDLVRWVYERLCDIERHETAEFLRIGGVAPFYPHHDDQGSPYEHVERWEETPWA